jgi:hypothetical protein
MFAIDFFKSPRRLKAENLRVVRRVAIHRARWH